MMEAPHFTAEHPEERGAVRPPLVEGMTEAVYWDKGGTVRSAGAATALMARVEDRLVVAAQDSHRMDAATAASDSLMVALRIG